MLASYCRSTCTCTDFTILFIYLYLIFIQQHYRAVLRRVLSCCRHRWSRCCNEQTPNQWTIALLVSILCLLDNGMPEKFKIQKFQKKEISKRGQFSKNRKKIKMIEDRRRNWNKKAERKDSFSQKC